jgi:hypothetical protein
MNGEPDDRVVMEDTDAQTPRLLRDCWCHRAVVERIEHSDEVERVAGEHEPGPQLQRIARARRSC